MKKLICLFLAFVFCVSVICGCEKTESKPTEITFEDYTLPTVASSSVLIYYPDYENNRLLSLTVQLSGDSLYKSIMDILLKGSENYKSCFPANVRCNSIKLIQNILYVDLSSEFLKQSYENRLVCCRVIAYTYTSLSEIDFVNVSVNGKQLTVESNGKNIMLFSAFSGTLAEMTAKLDKADSFYSVIYSSDVSGTYLLPEVVNIRATDDFGNDIISALIALDNSIFNGDFLLSETAYNDRTLSVTLVAPPSWKPDENWLAFDAIANSTRCIYPDLLNVSVTVLGSSGELLYSALRDCSAAEASIRSKLDIFVPGDDGISFTSMLVSEMPSRGDFKTFIGDYICAVEPSFYGKNIVNNAILSNDKLVVDLSNEYFDAYASLSDKKEYAVVYSLIVTLCTYSGANSVQLLSSGKVRSAFSHKISLKNPLYNLPEDFVNSLK